MLLLLSFDFPFSLCLALFFSNIFLPFYFFAVTFGGAVNEDISC